MLQDIFKAMLITSFTGTTLTLILTLIKPITKRYFTHGWHYYMWLIVLAVMLIPVRVSLFDNVPSAIGVKSNRQTIEEKTSYVTEVPIQVTERNLQLNSDSKEGNAYNRLENLKSFAYDKLNIVAYVWFAVTVMLFLRKIIGYMIFLIKLRKYSDVISCPELIRFTNKKIITRTSDKISSPLMIGLFKPTLLLPKTVMTSEQLDNVLAHEMIHFKRKDILYKWFINITKCIHWFNPVIYYIDKQVDIECEISCDSLVVKDMSEQQKIDYVNTILTLVTAGNRKTSALTTGMTCDKKTLKMRFIMIKRKKRTQKSTRIISLILAAVLFSAAVFSGGVLASNMFKEYTDITFVCNGKAIEFNNKPFYKNNTVYLPLRELLNKIGIMDHKSSGIEWIDGRVIIKLAYDDTLQNYDEQVLLRKKSIFGDTQKTQIFCYAIEIGKAEYIINPKEALPSKSDKFKMYSDYKENMKYAPVLKGNITYVPYEYIDRFLGVDMGGLDSYGIDGPYNITCIVNSDNPIAYVSPCFFWPAENDIHNSVSNGFGEKTNSVTGEKIKHNGVDTIAKENSNVFCAIRGRVVDIGFNNDLGNYVAVENDSGVSTLYAHLYSVDVKIGDELYKRANIGKVGKTGSAVGAFLHFEIKINNVYYDPMKFWDENPLNDIEVIDSVKSLSQAGIKNNGSEIKKMKSAAVNVSADNSEKGNTASLAVPQSSIETKIKSTVTGDEPYIGYEHLVLNNADTNTIKQELNKQGIIETKNASVDLTKNYIVKDYNAERTKVTSDKNGNISLYLAVDGDNLFDVRFYDVVTGEDVGSYSVLANNENAYTFIGFEKGKVYNIEVEGKSKDDWAINGNYIIY